MSQTTLNIRIDEDMKKQFEAFCSNVGMNVTTAISIFVKTVVREQRIPFEISADPFYSQSNINYLTNIAQDISEGKAHFAEHDLIEVE